MNHTFILREIRGLRELGMEIHVISIRGPDRPVETLSAIEQDEARRTFTVLAAGFGPIVGAHVGTLLRRPLRYLAGLFFAIRLGGANLRAAFMNVLYFGEAVIAGRHLEKLSVGHTHCHFSSTVALLMARVFPVTFSATIHGPDEFNDPAGFYLREKMAAARFLCAISDYAASQLMKISGPEHWPKLEVARLGVDTNVFSPPPDRHSGECVELLSVGRLAPVKAQVLLISALGRLVREGRTQLRLRLAGEGEMRPQLERLIVEEGLSQHVILEGACNQARVLELYRQADLFVLPSLAEGVPVVLMEAMAMEIPCIATWVAGVPELIRHDVDGWLIAPGNEDELASAIAKLLDDCALRRRLGQSGRLRVQDRYELGKNVEILKEIYVRRLARNDS